MKSYVVCLLSACLLVGCSREESPPPLAGFNPTSSAVVEFSVPDMMCAEGCGTKTKEILSKQPGARDVLVDFESKTVYVAVDEGQFSPEAAIAVLVDYGFDNSTQKSP